MHTHTHTHTHTHIHTTHNTHTHTQTVENYLAIKKSEFLQFATTWMTHEGIILSKISQA